MIDQEEAQLVSASLECVYTDRPEIFELAEAMDVKFCCVGTFVFRQAPISGAHSSTYQGA